MIKNVLIGALIIISLVSVGYSYTKKAEAERLAMMAYEAEIKANEFQKLHAEAMHEIEIQRTLCEEQLKELKSK